MRYPESPLRRRHQPAWPSPEVLTRVLERLRELPPLVDAESCHALSDRLSAVARGEAVVLQAGECAELFTDSASPVVTAKVAQLHELSGRLRGSGRQVVPIGRLAGQYAKPRSHPTEMLPDGTEIPVYLGDAVNATAPTHSARRPDPVRLLAAYRHAARALLAMGDLHTSHEALLLDYEHALLRPDRVRGGWYASSAHTVWIGERTRELDGAHVDFAAGIGNPVGVKVGPTATPGDVRALVERLTAGHAPGRLCLVVRMGAARIGQRLPALADALRDHADRVVWLSDPMHGNTTRSPHGRKTRIVEVMAREVEVFCAVLRAHGARPGGLHLEVSPDDVTECVDRPADLVTEPDFSRYTSACDPRLNRRQASALVGRFAELLAAQ
ncbi:3-deoxy-7-phosphoheptulonate synthase [Saccharothrix sp. CB00851]|nr:3-deoxy-7-phosphoheptulonate synthase [Saccharothrix sp. CB00851]